MARAKPYVGVTGVTTKSEVHAVLTSFHEAGYAMDSPHVPMIGYLASWKTLHGEQVTNRRYPKIYDLYVLLKAAAGQALVMMHYNSREQNTLAAQIRDLFAGIYKDNMCRTLQLNVVWPLVDQVEKIKELFPKMSIVFQASRTAMQKKSPEEIAHGIRRYGNTLEYILIDPSGGRGQTINVPNAVQLWSALRQHTPNLKIGFAGGFSEENVADVVQELIYQTGTDDFCIDAESGLRNKRSPEYGDDDLNLKKVNGYLSAVSRIVK